MTSLDPGGQDHRLAQARALLDEGHGATALAAYSQILSRDLTCAPAFFGAGQALEMLGDLEAAAASYHHAAAITLGFAAPVGALSQLSLRARQTQKAAELAQLALKIDPGDPAAGLTLAELDNEQGQPQTALLRAGSAAAGAAAPLLQALARRVEGEAWRRLGQPDKTFAAYSASAAIYRRQFAGRCAGPAPLNGVDLCDALATAYGAARDARWAPAATVMASDDPLGHVFIVGFPRSGTTLLEQVLAGHPEVVTLEEQPTLTGAIDAYLDPPTGLEALFAMDAAAADTWRADYWARVRAMGVEPAGRIFVDKQPFYTPWLPLIAKLFPRARIVVVRRDPRDVIWSCFRHPFRMTPITYELMDLNRAVRLYDGYMRIEALFRARAANPVFVYRHEDLVADFDTVSGALCAFLGLTWTDALRDFAATARTRTIRTPSAAQVARGLNRDGLGAWRPYAPYLESTFDALQPWMETYGYAL